MEHSFDVDVAKKYGIEEAILLKNIQFWIEKNKANNVNYYDGYYWTYNSKKAFAELFPYMSERKIDYTLNKMIEQGLIVTGNYNKVAYDRTLWYAITKLGYSILRNCEMEETKLLNGRNKIVEPIPDITSDITSNINSDKKERKKGTTSYDEIISSLVADKEIQDLLIEFVKMRKLIKKPMTDYALERLIKKLFNMSNSTPEQKQILTNSITSSWQDIYPLKAETKTTTNPTTKQLNEEYKATNFSREYMDSLITNLDDVEV